MPPSLPLLAEDRPRKMIGMRGESRRKPLAEADEGEKRRAFGRLLDRVLTRARISKQEASFRMGFRDQSAISRWVSGVETAHMHKLWAIGADFREAFLLESAEDAGESVEVRTVVTVKRKRESVSA